jgi:serralysin
VVSIVNPTGNQDIDALLWGYRWDSTSFTFSFPTSSAEYGGYGTISGFQVFNAAQQTAVREAFAQIASYVNLTFTETTSAGATFRFAEASAIDLTADDSLAQHNLYHSVTTAEATPPELGYGGNPPVTPIHAQGDSWYNTSTYNNPLRGTFALQAGIWHEMLHNMGLKHGHSTQSGHGVTFPALPSDHDSYEYSIMTYRQHKDDTPGTDTAPHHATTMMINDIAALQYLYGANYNTQSGNTVYRWDTAGNFYINNVFQFGSSAAGTFIFQAVWDGNGTDTYDFSAFSSNQTVNLEPGSYSTTPGMQANIGSSGTPVLARGTVYNAYLNNGDLRSMIENVTTGGGNDTIYGNGVNNTIQSGAGGDTIYGFGGTDTIVSGSGADIVYGGDSTDYIDGRDGGDFIRGDGGDDVVFGDGFTTTYGAGSDLIFGDEGNDTLMGESGDHATGIGFQDEVHGGNGNDTIFGGAGGDWLFGEGGNDIMEGGFGSDLIVGGQGAEIMLGSGTSIYAAASTGGDLFVYTSILDGGDSIYGFDFNSGTGTDGIDLRTLFNGIGYTGTNARGDGFLYVFQNGANIDVYVDSNGLAGGTNLTHLCSLVNANAPATSLTDSFFLFQ